MAALTLFAATVNQRVQAAVDNPYSSRHPDGIEQYVVGSQGSAGRVG